RVVYGVAGVEHAGIHAEEGERTDKRVRHDLERERRERLAVAGLAMHFFLVLVQSRHCRAVDWRGQQLDDAIEHGLHALVLERRTAEHRDQRRRERTRTQTSEDVRLGQVTFLQVLVHQLFGGLRRR